MRGAQLATLLAFLVLWEVLPKAQIVNPLFTSYPSALWPTFVDLLAETPRQAGILTHTWSTVFATVIGFTAAMVVGIIIAAALWWWNDLYKVLDPYLVVANAMPKTAFVPIFYIWLGPTLSIYGMSLAISVFVAILMIYSGFQGIDPNKIKLAQTFGATKRQVLTKVVLPGSIPTLIAALKVNVGLSLVGVVVGEFQSANIGLGYLIQYGSQILQAQHRDDSDHHFGHCLIADVSRDLVARSCRDAPAVGLSAAIIAATIRARHVRPDRLQYVRTRRRPHRNWRWQRARRAHAPGQRCFRSPRRRTASSRRSCSRAANG